MQSEEKKIKSSEWVRKFKKKINKIKPHNLEKTFSSYLNSNTIIYRKIMNSEVDFWEKGRKSTSCELFIATWTQPDNKKETELLSKI